MSFFRCPTCARRIRLDVSDVEGWYRERWPLTPVGAEVPEECPECLDKRTGTALLLTERVRPYRREEFAGQKSRLPERGAQCPGCGSIIPKFADLDLRKESRVRDLIQHHQIIAAIKELVDATGCPLAWAHLWVSHPRGPELHKRSGPACYYCGKPLRSATARQCVECGLDWHDLRHVVRLGRPVNPPAGEGPPDRLGGDWVVAWARVGTPPPAALAIVHGAPSDGWLLFRCDAVWNVTADTWHASLAEAQAQASTEIEGIAERWRYRPPPG